MKVMILGAGGPIGDRVAKLLLLGGHDVLNVSRQARGTGRTSWVTGDRADPDAI